MPRVISIVSGKGGSGKSLLTAVLGRAIAREGQRVLLIDLDIFVRGLTVLMFSFRRPEATKQQATVSTILGIFANQRSKSREPPSLPFEKLLIQRFLECDLLPAVERINAPLDYDDRSLSSEQFCWSALKRLLKAIGNRYDYILLDNRAGMDSLISASCRVSDIVLTVAEDDEVGRQTNANLVSFLQNKKFSKHVYSIVNKGRGIKTYSDIEDRFSHRSDFGVLGVIPFDIEVLDTFGRDSFWSQVTETLYFRAAIRAWNQLAKAEAVDQISESKYRFPPKIFMSKSQGRFTMMERMLRMYAFAFIIGGVTIWLYYQYLRGMSEFEIGSIASILFGVLALMLSTSGFQRLFYPRDTSE